MKRADLSSHELCRTIANHGVWAWEQLIWRYPPKVVLAAIERDDKQGYLEWGVSARRPFLTDKGRLLAETLVSTSENAAPLPASNSGAPSTPEERG